MTVRNAASMGNYGAEWESRGYAGGGNVGSLLGSLRGRPAIIAGNACTVFSDMERATKIAPDAVIFGVNDIMMYLPRLDHGVSLHGDNIQYWKAVRWQRSTRLETAYYHSVDGRPYLDYAWERLTPCFALSGYFAMQIAWLMGCSPILLCGCPGNLMRRFFEGTPREDKQDQFGYGGGDTGSDEGIRQQIISEMQRLPDFKEAVFSMSGWTKTFFGGWTPAHNAIMAKVEV